MCSHASGAGRQTAPPDLQILVTTPEAGYVPEVGDLPDSQKIANEQVRYLGRDGSVVQQESRVVDRGTSTSPWPKVGAPSCGRSMQWRYDAVDRTNQQEQLLRQFDCPLLRVALHMVGLGASTLPVVPFGAPRILEASRCFEPLFQMSCTCSVPCNVTLLGRLVEQSCVAVQARLPCSHVGCSTAWYELDDDGRRTVRCP